MQCAYCGADILFGGYRDDPNRYCNKRCYQSHVELKSNLQLAKDAYDQALAGVRASPTDPAAREAALAAGRMYAQWCRHAQSVQGKGLRVVAGGLYAGHADAGRVTVFDEVALDNDLKAAAAAAASVPADQQPQSPEQRLERLAALKAKGLISEREYEEKRSAILAEL